ncbi:hypothetical protein SDC9_147828 [bioreactor metagenome]|uniref:Uncharacterized protein n=1 Tax=bioreactor metagenome TaxID=1076179 RepID=A0A645EH80_9ZZZZ
MEALGDGVAVAAVGGGDEVGDVEHAAYPGSGRFLADGEVRRTAIIIVADDFVSAGPALQDHFFKFPDHQHRFVDFEQFGLGDIFGLEFRRHVRIVLISRNAVQFDRGFFEARSGITVVIVAHFVDFSFVLGDKPSFV